MPRRTRKLTTPPSSIVRSCRTTSATRRSRTVLLTVATAARAAASQDSSLTPMTSVTRYTLSAICGLQFAGRWGSVLPELRGAVAKSSPCGRVTARLDDPRHHSRELVPVVRAVDEVQELVLPDHEVHAVGMRGHLEHLTPLAIHGDDPDPHRRLRLLQREAPCMPPQRSLPDGPQLTPDRSGPLSEVIHHPNI